MPSIKNKWPFKQKRLGTTGVDNDMRDLGTKKERACLWPCRLETAIFRGSFKSVPMGTHKQETQTRKTYKVINRYYIKYIVLGSKRNEKEENIELPHFPLENQWPILVIPDLNINIKIIFICLEALSAHKHNNMTIPAILIFGSLNFTNMMIFKFWKKNYIV